MHEISCAFGTLFGKTPGEHLIYVSASVIDQTSLTSSTWLSIPLKDFPIDVCTSINGRINMKSKYQGAEFRLILAY